MANITLFVPDLFKEKMKQFKNLRWSNVVRTVIESKLEDFEEAEALAAKSKLTAADVDALTKKVDDAAAKKARALLNEASG